MKHAYASTLAVLAAVTGVANAADPPNSLGAYVGAEVGTANSSATVPAYVGSITVDKNPTGWTVFAGVRPKKYYGAELDYTDFGNAKVTNLQQDQLQPPDVTYVASAKNTAFSGYVIGYLPMVPSGWDLFAKAGFASLTTRTHSEGNYPNACTGQPCMPIGMASLSSRHQQAYFTYGFGTQYRFGALGVRAEYQRINSTFVNPHLISVGVYWKF